jgi:A/G-specific adenine glycosylase
MTSRSLTMSSEPSLAPAAVEALLAWYRPRRRAFAWRRTRDPYAIWVSEIMLQQTQAARVEPSFTAFMERFPTVRDLASAPRASVIRAWSGLGYNRRAVALHEAARVVVREHGGRLPRAASALRSLPGIGPYTAAAVTSIAFGQPEPALDVNARRVWARSVVGVEPGEVPLSVLDGVARRSLPTGRAGAFNQALMDLGREWCRSRPRCDGCPLAPWCRSAGGAGSGSTAGRQPRFEGSRRQARGRIIEALRRTRSLPVDEVAGLIPGFASSVDDLLADLVRDGLVEVGGGRIRLRR